MVQQKKQQPKQQEEKQRKNAPPVPLEGTGADFVPYPFIQCPKCGSGLIVAAGNPGFNGCLPDHYVRRHKCRSCDHNFYSWISAEDHKLRNCPLRR